jgi:hypothetical protein
LITHNLKIKDMIRDFVARKHGKEREPWVQKPMPFPPKSTKKKDDEEFERFAEMLRPVFLRTRLTDILMMAPYEEYMKDVISNKRKILEAEISTVLANYSFKDGVPKKLGDLELIKRGAFRKKAVHKYRHRLIRSWVFTPKKVPVSSRQCLQQGGE